ncbi:MAG: hypothetical protein ACQER2_07610 [Bacillota bacterium]
MSRHYRYKLPEGLRRMLTIFECWLTPLLVYQFFRTIMLPTSFDVVLLLIVALLYCSFYFKWI